jgi:hypothetical protein
MQSLYLKEEKKILKKMESKNMKTKVYDYNLKLVGLYGRNRKVKDESFTIIRDSEKQLSADEIKIKAESFLKTLKVKDMSYCAINEVDCELEDMDGVTFKSHVIKFGKPPILILKEKVKSFEEY